ncbi:MAG: outer membrane beta-barrel protein [Fodinibius sp.]|nr:outer membrane beta-barrel protein [Fodinibius sp.]
MKLKKILLAFAAFAVLLSAAPQTASAQWSLGASYEIRNEEPKNGFGARIEREILGGLPLVNVGIRAHFSYFNDENSINYNDGSTSYSYSQDITNYDYGLAAVGGVTVGPINPYVGLGLGATSLDVNRSDLPNNSAFNKRRLMTVEFTGMDLLEPSSVCCLFNPL